MSVDALEKSLEELVGKLSPLVEKLLQSHLG